MTRILTVIFAAALLALGFIGVTQDAEGQLTAFLVLGLLAFLFCVDRLGKSLREMEGELPKLTSDGPALPRYLFKSTMG